MKTDLSFVLTNVIRRTTLIFLFSISLMFTACKEELDLECVDSTIETTSLEKEYGCADTRYSLQIALSNDYKIIRSQADFDQFVTGSCKPQIDFSKYDLVIGKKNITSGGASIDCKLKTNCETQTFNLEVLITQDVTTTTGVVTYHSLIPKMKSEQKLNVNITRNLAQS